MPQDIEHYENKFKSMRKNLSIMLQKSVRDENDPPR